jgi:hypothetical protein
MAQFGLPDGELGALHVLALGMAEGDAFVGGEGFGHRLFG